MADKGERTTAVTDRPTEKNESCNFIASLQMLTSSMPSVEMLAVKTKEMPERKPVAKRGRKKKSAPIKVAQPKILPKVFALQIAPQANVIAPVTTVVSQSILQSAGNKPLDSVSHQPQTASITQMPFAGAKEPDSNLKQATEGQTQAESIKLAGNFHYVTNNSQPAQFDSEELTLGSRGFQKIDHKRRVHNASEKRRKERINGWIAKIASALFKHCPEKQHKIFILEKAYNFINEKKSQEQGVGKQDAFTQADPAEGESFSSLVGKVIELERLLHSLLAIIQQYKIPAPSSLFKSHYVKKLAVAHLNNDNSTEVPTLPCGAVKNVQYAVNGSSTKSSADTNFNQKKNRSLLNVRNCISQNMANASTVPQAEPQLCVTVSSKTLPFVDTSVNYNVGVELNSTPKVPLGDSSIGVLPVNNGTASITNELSVGQSTQKDIEVICGKSQATIMQGTLSAKRPGDFPCKNITDINAGKAMDISGNQGAIASTTGNILNNVPNHSATALVNLPSETVNGNMTANAVASTNKEQIVTSSNDAGSFNAAASQAQLVNEATTKPPSMASQMFVMKNLVNSRCRNSAYNYNVYTSESVNMDQTGEVKRSHAAKLTHSQGMHMENRNVTDQVFVGKASGVSKATGNELAPRNESNEASFVRIAARAPVSCQQVQRGSVHSKPSVVNSNSSALNARTISVGGKRSTKRPAKLLKLPVDSSKVKNTDSNSQQLRAVVGTQTGSSGIQTCHSVTSLLSNMTTSPTENATLSIDKILADKTSSWQDLPAERSISQTVPQTVPQAVPQVVPQAVPQAVPQVVPQTVPQAVPQAVPQVVPQAVPQAVPQTSQNLDSLMSSRSDIGPRKRPSSSQVPRKQSNPQMANLLQISCNQNAGNSPRPSPKRAKKTQSQQTSKAPVSANVSGQVSQYAVRSTDNKPMPARSVGKMEDRSKAKKRNDVRHSIGLTHSQGGSMFLPKPHNFVSLARKDQRNRNVSATLGQFSTESLLRNNGSTSSNQSFVGDAEPDMSLPTILNIFAPASIGNMVNQIQLPNNLPNAQNLNANASFPTIQSTFSNFSAETLIGGQMENQPAVHAVINSTPNGNENTLVQSEQQTLFTDFSTDALLAGTESSLSYGIDNIMSRNDVVASNSCVSPNWLQTGSFIDNSPIRGSFNQGFNIFDTPNNLQGYIASLPNAGFTTPIKWRQDLGRADEQNVSLTPSSSIAGTGLWGQPFTAMPLKTPQNGQSKSTQKTKGTRGQPNSKRGPSFGDFLLVDSVS